MSNTDTIKIGKLWTSPELLRMPHPTPEGSPKGDVYSFAIIAHEIVIRKGVFLPGGTPTHTQRMAVAGVKRTPSPTGECSSVSWIVLDARLWLRQ
ncbi:hypothetical protein CEXT_798911 [Caerostris extrusa]|uniref:Uncharacterized protein n=1 Tax=Caerostris extrusa TaxID=172846 RepID=A0AAV4MJJ2_CAEEX|nr:hypothetical protein CEXT_798911 [Caerostris extrusa]